ncbi:hypothetical protein [Streptomyces sp. NPDC093060]|uniref:hypothetical protein n=1 Tax=Streptomyces sp. NPDC093060 TaxID=3366019 RepID=UPI00381909C5
MTDRKQARAMDLPDYPCPPSLGQVPAHAGSWGWFWPVTTSNADIVIAQDPNGYLWVRSSTRLDPHPDISTKVSALAAWTEDGLGLYVPKEAYKYVRRFDGSFDELEWTPVAVVLKEPPGYALTFNQP